MRTGLQVQGMHTPCLNCPSPARIPPSSPQIVKCYFSIAYCGDGKLGSLLIRITQFQNLLKRKPLLALTGVEISAKLKDERRKSVPERRGAAVRECSLYPGPEP